MIGPLSKPLESYQGDLEDPATWRGLGFADRSILQQHLAQGTLPVGRAFFNLPVGSLPTPIDPLTLSDAQLILWEPWYKRVDLVIADAIVSYVIEIKPAAGYVALGQAITMTHLIDIGWTELLNPTPLVLTDAIDPDCAPCFTKLNILFRVIDETEFRTIGTPT